ncbi:MAG: hypothetical protein J0I48_12655 [Devosia sp.]|uniref:hypothetical protein n=1 Tax=Devosia sp. 66-22 TaxID=1895753 RepID=UPI000A75F05B|nr:hypothetical protein [Devosia sp. 66-22]MBN9347030.1 hypothetical protein [Devosia sp.]
MARPVEHFRASDITFWGVFALITWAVAVLGANVSAFIPDSMLGGLHASRLSGGNLNQLRGQVAALESETARLRQENGVLLQRFALNEQAGGEVTRRVGALELTVPQILDALSTRGPGIDTGTTASTGTSSATSFDVPGGSVSYTTTPMSGIERQSAPDQPMPEAIAPLAPDSNAFGIALGPPIDADEGETAWRSMNTKVGTLLLGMGPLLANVEGGAGKRLVVGPVATEADARQLCGHMAKVGIACASVPFIGTPLPLLN